MIFRWFQFHYQLQMHQQKQLQTYRFRIQSNLVKCIKVQKNTKQRLIEQQIRSQNCFLQLNPSKLKMKFLGRKKIEEHSNVNLFFGQTEKSLLVKIQNLQFENIKKKLKIYENIKMLNYFNDIREIFYIQAIKHTTQEEKKIADKASNSLYLLINKTQANSLQIQDKIGQLSQEKIRQYLYQLAQGIKLIHDQGIAHGRINIKDLTLVKENLKIKWSPEGIRKNFLNPIQNLKQDDVKDFGQTLCTLLREQRKNTFQMFVDKKYQDIWRKVINLCQEKVKIDDIIECLEWKTPLNQFVSNNKISQKNILQIAEGLIQSTILLKEHLAIGYYDKNHPYDEDQLYEKTKKVDRFEKNIMAYRDYCPDNVLIIQKYGKLRVKLQNWNVVYLEDSSSQAQIVQYQKKSLLSVGYLISWLLQGNYEQYNEFRKQQINNNRIENISRNRDYQQFWECFFKRCFMETQRQNTKIEEFAQQVKQYKKKKQRIKEITFIDGNENRFIQQVSILYLKLQKEKSTIFANIYSNKSYQRLRYIFYPEKDIIYNKKRLQKEGNSIVYGQAKAFKNQNQFQNIEQSCIIKHIPAQWKKINKYIVRQISNCRKLMQLKHPNIVDILDIFYIDKLQKQSIKQQYGHLLIQDSYYFVMKHYQGAQNLYDWIHKEYKQNDEIYEQTIIQILSQIIDGVHFLHQTLNMMHRDLKLQNILIYKEKNKWKIKIIDFGVSRAIGSLKLTKVGTSNYIAPEVMQSQQYNEKCDVWSIGVIIYVLLTKEDLTKASSLEKNKSQLQSIDIKNKIKEALEKITQTHKDFFKEFLEKTLVKEHINRVSITELKQIILNKQIQLKKQNPKSQTGIVLSFKKQKINHQNNAQKIKKNQNSQTPKISQQKEEQKPDNSNQQPEKKQLILQIMSRKPIKQDEYKIIILISVYAIITILYQIKRSQIISFQGQFSVIGLIYQQQLCYCLNKLLILGYQKYTQFIQEFLPWKQLNGQQHLNVILSHKEQFKKLFRKLKKQKQNLEQYSGLIQGIKQEIDYDELMERKKDILEKNEQFKQAYKRIKSQINDKFLSKILQLTEMKQSDDQLLSSKQIKE